MFVLVVSVQGNRSDGQMGLLEILEEESHTAQATDENMVRRFHRVFSSNKYYHRTHKGDRACFGIRHYAGLVTTPSAHITGISAQKFLNSKN